MEPEPANINVIVRCRGRIKQEIAAKSAVVVKVAPPSEISINTSDETGLAGDIASKTFTLDRVYGPDTDQSQFFQGTAEPLFKDFLNGFNCTMFAYGQTGTGKTHTMHGDESITNGSFNPNAGIIPRVLYTLFDTLECLRGTDFIVRCSFLELYNEELRDLLAVSEKRLRIYEQQGNDRTTIVTQGLEEVVLRNAAHGMRVLQAGIRRRQTAATRMNDTSSRLHTIFTLSLFKQKENTEYRVSKFNLVDLAGSENIGRSGAVNQRAKEAGSINQSLLTLGRVINALVDGDSHIPYRESKLTRLLQDSLGGHTKTVLVATVSPAKMNCEETLSTLQYASKAKNIKNKPQIGSMILRTALVRELGSELARLKADLDACRTKNGIYMDAQNYQELQMEIQDLRTRASETKLHADSLQRQVDSLRAQLQESTQTIARKNEELDSYKTTVRHLCDKISRQTDNNRSLIENSSRFKAVVEMMTENMLFMAGNERQLKDKLSATLDSQISEKTKSIEEKVLRILEVDSSGLASNLESLKADAKAELDAVRNLLANLPDTIMQNCIVLYQDSCKNIIYEMRNLHDEASRLKDDFSQHQEGLKHLISQLTSGANDMKRLLTKEYEERIEEELQIQESEMIDSLIALVQEKTRKQRSVLASRLIDRGVELSRAESKVVFTGLSDHVKEFEGVFHKATNQLVSSSTHLRQYAEALITREKKTHGELAKTVGEISARLKSDSERDKMFDELIGKGMEAVEQKLNIIKTEAQQISNINNELNEGITELQNEIYQAKERPELPNNPQVIQQKIEELQQEETKISNSLMPTGKTPKVDFHSPAKDRLYTPNRSPSKRVISDLKNLNFDLDSIAESGQILADVTENVLQKPQAARLKKLDLLDVPDLKKRGTKRALEKRAIATKSRRLNTTKPMRRN